MNSNLPAEKKELTAKEWQEINDHLGIVIEHSQPLPAEIPLPNPFLAKPIVKEVEVRPSTALAAAIELLNSCGSQKDIEAARAQRYVTLPVQETPRQNVRYGMEYLPTNMGDKPVDRTLDPLTTVTSIGGQKVDWKEICLETTKRNIAFQYWKDGLSFRFVQDNKLCLYAKNRFWQETCEKRYAEDILKTCKFLSLPISWVNITVRE